MAVIELKREINNPGGPLYGFYWDTATRRAYRVLLGFGGAGASNFTAGDEIGDQWCDEFRLTKVLMPADVVFDTEIDGRQDPTSDFNMEFSVVYNSTVCGFNPSAVSITSITQAVDGSTTTVTINATGTNAPFTYSLDGITYQSSNEFAINNSTDYGTYTAYVKNSASPANIDTEDFVVTEVNSYGPLYRCEFDDEEGTTWTCDIEQLGYSGSVTEVLGGGNPLTIKWGNQETEKYATVLGSRAVLEVNSSTDFQYVNLFTSNDTDYRLTVYKAGVMYWQGLISPEDYSEPYLYPGYAVKFEFLDGLGRLKRKNFLAGSGDFFTGYKTEIEFLKICLKNTGLELPIHVAVDIHETRADGNPLTVQENLFSNPFFDDGLTDWSQSSTGTTWVDGFVVGVGGSINFVGVTSNASASKILYQSIDLVEDYRYTLLIDCYKPNPSSTDSLPIDVVFDADLATESSTTGYLVTDDGLVTITFTAARNYSRIGIRAAADSDDEGLFLRSVSLVRDVPVYSVPVVRNPFAVTAVNSDAFKSAENEPDTCYEVLEKILKKYGCRIAQVEGRWEILNIDLLQESSYVKEVYNYEGVNAYTNVLSNSDFASGSTGWTDTNWNYTLVGSDYEAQASTALSSAELWQAYSGTAGLAYRLRMNYQVSGVGTSSADVSVYLDYGLAGETLITSTTLYEKSDFVELDFWFTPTDDFTRVGLYYDGGPGVLHVRDLELYPGFEEVEPTRNLTNSTGSPLLCFLDSGQVFNMRKAYKQLTVKCPVERLNASLVPNSDFSSFTDGVPDLWEDNNNIMSVRSVTGPDGGTSTALELSTEGGTLYSVSSTPVYVDASSGEVKIGVQLRFYMSTTTGGVVQVYFKVECAGHFLKQDGTWSTSEQSIELNYNASTELHNTWVNYSLESDVVPTSGFIRLSLSQVEQLSGVDHKIYYDYARMNYSEFDSSPVPEEKSVTFTNPDNFTYAATPVGLAFCDMDEFSSPTVFKNTMVVLDSTTGTSEWTRYGEGETEKLISLLARRMMNNYRRPTRQLRGRLRGYIGINDRITDSTNLSGLAFIVSSLSSNIKKNTHEVELNEIVRVSTEGEYDLVQESDGTPLQFADGEPITDY